MKTLDAPLTYTVFTDFDGTITVNDIGDLIFERFAKIDVCIDSFAAYRRGEINARECWRRGFASMQPLTRQEFTQYVLSQPIDSSFKAFVEYCSRHNIPVTVLSDGFDAYIKPVMNREGLDHLPRFSNELLFNNDRTVAPAFPHTDAECQWCANCKRNHMLTNASDQQVIVYVGDGVSDRCPAQFADIIFAKDSLVSFCETHNITFHRFQTFTDVLSQFRSIVEKKTPKKRRTAELARKEIFMME